jgi:hypothetical protein
MAQRRTTHRSSKGTKLYAVRNADGTFEDIQTYKRAHAADLRASAKAETSAKSKTAVASKAAKAAKKTAKAAKKSAKKTAKKPAKKITRKPASTASTLVDKATRAIKRVVRKIAP